MATNLARPRARLRLEHHGLSVLLRDVDGGTAPTRPFRGVPVSMQFQPVRQLLERLQPGRRSRDQPTMVDRAGVMRAHGWPLVATLAAIDALVASRPPSVQRGRPGPAPGVATALRLTASQRRAEPLGRHPDLVAVASGLARRSPSVAQSFAGRLVRQLNVVREFAAEEELNAEAALVTESLQARLRSLPPGPVTTSGMLALCLMVLVYWRTATQSELSMADRIGRVEQQLLDDIDESLGARTHDARDRACTTSAEFYPSGGMAPSPSRLLPRQRVRLVEQRGKWATVDAFDHLDAALRRGWVRKKYLCRLERQQPPRPHRRQAWASSWSRPDDGRSLVAAAGQPNEEASAGAVNPVAWT